MNEMERKQKRSKGYGEGPGEKKMGWKRREARGREAKRREGCVI